MELSEKTKTTISYLTSSHYNFANILKDKSVAWREIFHYNIPCCISAVEITNNIIPHDGDILIGFYALEPIEFSMKVTSYLPAWLQNNQPKLFEPITHCMAKNTFVYAYTQNNKDYVVNMIGMHYNNITLHNVKSRNTKLLCVYGYLKTDERLKIADLKQSLFYICPSFENRMVSKIQKQWRECVSNPQYMVCRRRLHREILEW